MESLKRALESIGRMWSTLNATQRVILSAASVVMVLLLVWGSSSTTETWVRVAGPEVEASSRRDILKKLQDQNQKHEVRGNEILVPKQDADRIVLELAGEGAMSDDVIWKFLETSDPFVDRRQKDLRYQHALEKKLSAMIRCGEAIRNARVVITPGSESSRLGFEGARATASVQVELQEGKSLASKNIAAIANLVAKSVQGLDADQVVITDNKLNSYSLPKEAGGGSSPQFFRDYEKLIEDDLKAQIKQAFRTASVVVRITARNTRIKKDSEKFTNPKVLREEERKSVEKSGTVSPSRGLKGEDGVVLPPETGGRSDQENKAEYKHDRESTQEDNPAGKIERITIGVLIPIEVGPDGKELIEAEKQKGKIREWVLAAADAPEKSVSVEFIASKKLDPVVTQAETPQAWDWIAARWSKIMLGALALAAVLVILRVIQGAMAKDTVEELQALTSALTETQEAQAELAAPAETDLARLKQGLQDMVGRNPQTVAASLKSFMSGR